MIIGPNPAQLNDMWKRARETGKNMVVLGQLPGSGVEFGGTVVNRGEIRLVLLVRDGETANLYTVHPEWIYSATLVIRPGVES